MSRRDFYEGLTLADALRLLVAHHGEERTRHLSQDECELLDRAAGIIEREAPGVGAFS